MPPTDGTARFRGVIRVMHVVLSLEPGGLERLVVDLALRGSRLGHKVSVLCIERAGVLASGLEPTACEVVCVHKRPGLRIGTVQAVRRELGRIQPDVVHTHQIGALFYAGPAASIERVPVIVHTEHGKHYKNARRTRLLGRIAARHASRFFCVSGDIAEEVRACRITNSSRILTVPNGIDTLKFAQPHDGHRVREELGIPPGCAVLGTVGRLVEIKRQDLLIRAFAKVRLIVPDARLLIVGDGPLRSELHALVHELGIATHVHFAGYQPNPERYLRVMEVFALTSRSEGMPLSVLEAWAASVPVVAPRVGGLADMIDHGRTGLLYDYPQTEQLVDALVRLLTRPTEARELAAAGLRRVTSQYDLEVMSNRYDAQYRELLGLNSAR